MTLQTLALALSFALLGAIVFMFIRARSVTHALTKWSSVPRFWTAVIARLAIGGVLMAAAPQCYYPPFVTVVGALTLCAAVGILIAGRARLDRVLAWFTALPLPKVRLWLAGALGVMVALVFSVGV